MMARRVCETEQLRVAAVISVVDDGPLTTKEMLIKLVKITAAVASFSILLVPLFASGEKTTFSSRAKSLTSKQRRSEPNHLHCSQVQ